MKQEVTITLKVRLMVSGSDRNMLAKTASVYREACDFVSDYVFDTGDEKVYSLNEVPDIPMRGHFFVVSEGLGK